MCSTLSTDRTYPLHKPKGHHLPVPRYTLKFGDDVEAVYTLYIGVQQHSKERPASQAALHLVHMIHEKLKSDKGPCALELFDYIEGQDAPNTKIWVGYWTSATQYSKILDALSLQSIFHSINPGYRSLVGLWLETFTTARSRLETNYSGLDYLPGLARLPNAVVEEHDLATYWGAARDRIPDSAHDLFSPQASDVKTSQMVLEGLGQSISGTNHENMVYIRSGQFWENCTDEEAQAYEEKLEPTLQAGLQWLHDYPSDSGATGVRYVRNTDLSSLPLISQEEMITCKERKETSGIAFFRNLEDLEKWAKGHKSHLAIYGGALKHYKAFPQNRMMRTWHEVSVLKARAARFEYFNCVKGTGVMDSLAMPEVEAI